MKNPNIMPTQECPWCQGTNIEEDLNIVRCTDCGMGKYKNGRQKRN